MIRICGRASGSRARLRRILLAGLCLVAGPAAANDQALIDFLGYSGDFRYFAYEEYGVQDGSGSAYSSIHVLDLWADAELAGAPFDAAGHRDKAACVDRLVGSSAAVWRRDDLTAANP